MPVSASHASITTAPSISTSLHGTKAPTILVVDDRAINRDFLLSLLKHFRYELREAQSAEQAWDVVVNGGIDLIITDVFMGGMDGLTLLEKLATDPAAAHIPAIVYSAAHKHPDIERLVRAHQIQAVLSKPSAPELILETVRAALGEEASALSPAQASEENKAHRTTTLIEIMQDLAEYADTASQLQAFCESSKGLLHARESLVYILPHGEKRVSQMFCSCEQLQKEADTLDASRLSDTLGRIIKEHAVDRFSNVNSRDYGIPLGGGKVSSLLCVPVFTPSHDYGCLCLIGKIDAEDFSDEDERLAVTLSSHVAVLYESTLLFEGMQALAAKLACEVEDRKRAEEDLVRSRAEQIRLKDQFLSHVSHELRSPVMVVQQFLEIVEAGEAGEINPQQRECMEIALRNVQQLNVMIGDLLDAARIEAGKLRVDLATIRLSELLKEAVDSARLAAARKHINLALESASDLPPVVADRSRVRQIVGNLVDNAIKFTGEKGEIKVRAAIVGHECKFVRITVSDTGCGLSPEEMSKVFERHYQVPNADCAARKGLGLGLCICKQLVQLQGGQIEVQSRPNQGSDFSFTLPIFSIPEIIAPLLARAPLSSVAVLSVTVPEGDRGKQGARPIRETIERCVLPDLDVALPDSHRVAGGQRFLIVARADEKGAAILAKRLQEQVKQEHFVADSSISPSCQWTIVDVSEMTSGDASSDQLAAATARVDEAVRAMLADRS